MSQLSMKNSMPVAHHEQLGAVVPVVDTQFDPIQLIGSLVPFMDPFANDFDYNDFRTTDFAGCRCASHPILASSLGCGEANPDSSQQAQYAPAAFIQLLQCSPMSARIFPPPGPAMHLETEPDAVPGRQPVKLTPEQAIDIFKIRKTKTARTARQLATKYGISPKAIRDIWMCKSWAQDTRPHWNE